MRDHSSMWWKNYLRICTQQRQQQQKTKTTVDGWIGRGAANLRGHVTTPVLMHKLRVIVECFKLWKLRARDFVCCFYNSHLFWMNMFTFTGIGFLWNRKVMRKSQNESTCVPSVQIWGKVLDVSVDLSDCQKYQIVVDITVSVPMSDNALLILVDPVSHQGPDMMTQCHSHQIQL